MPPDASQYRSHMAWVPGGNVIANVSGSPAALALSASGLIWAGVLAPAALSLLLRVIAWPLRLRSHGTIIGLTGEPARPIVDAERHAEKHVRCLVLADRELVADDGPRRLFRHRGVDAELLEVAELVRHHDRRTIGQRDDAEADVGGFRTIARVDAAGPPARHPRHEHRCRRRARRLDERASCRRFSSSSHFSARNT